ncbi:MAG: cytidine deaminase [Bdellovibrionota bacterium]
MKRSEQKISPLVQKAFKAALSTRARAHAPYSKFKVGAALVTTAGEIFTGCNVENASYGGTVCAERTAILKAVSEGEKKFSTIVVVTDAKNPATPCAFCLQVMAEFLPPKATIWIGDLKGLKTSYTFAELLPHPFGPNQLKDARATATEKN